MTRKGHDLPRMTTLFRVVPLLVCAAAFSVSTPSYAAVYAYVDPDGKLILSDHKENDQYKKFDPQYNPKLHRDDQAAGQGDQFRTRQVRKIAISGDAQRFDRLISAIAEEVGINQQLLHAVIQVESAYDPNAISAKGAKGLMQLIPATAQRFGIAAILDPESNIRAGARYLKYLLQLFNYDLQLALAAYNAGEGAVKKYNNTIPAYAETRDYVNRVITIFELRKFREKGRS